jgi:hypothetical protein
MQVFVVFVDPVLPGLVQESGIYRLESSRNQPPAVRPNESVHGRSDIGQVADLAMEAIAFIDDHEWSLAVLGGFVELLRRTRKKVKVRIEDTKGLTDQELEMIRGIGPEVTIVQEVDDVSFR